MNKFLIKKNSITVTLKNTLFDVIPIKWNEEVISKKKKVLVKTENIKRIQLSHSIIYIIIVLFSTTNEIISTIVVNARYFTVILLFLKLVLKQKQYKSGLFVILRKKFYIENDLYFKIIF